MTILIGNEMEQILGLNLNTVVVPEIEGILSLVNLGKEKVQHSLGITE